MGRPKGSKNLTKTKASSENEELIKTTENSSGSSGKSGNTKQISPAANWCFTLNNYTEEDIKILNSSIDPRITCWVFQEETGESGTPHLQGYIGFGKNKVRPMSIFSYTNRIRWSTTRNVKQAIAYCCKEDTRTGKIYHHGLKLPKPVKPLKLINPTKQWQKEILSIMDEEPSQRKVYWYWSEQGRIGKSQFAKYCIATRNCAFIDEGKKADIMHTIVEADMDECNCVIFDVPRENGNKVSYKSIESIKNGMVYSSKYDSNWKLFNSPHLFVFANEPPQEEKLSADRWVIKNIDEYGGLDEEEKYEDFIYFNYKNDIKINK